MARLVRTTSPWTVMCAIQNRFWIAAILLTATAVVAAGQVVDQRRGMEPAMDLETDNLVTPMADHQQPRMERPPVDTDIVEGDDDERRRQWQQNHRHFDPFFTVTTASPNNDNNNNNGTSADRTGTGSGTGNGLQEARFRNPTITPATKLEPFGHPLFLDSGFLRSRLSSKSKSDVIGEEALTTGHSRSGAQRSFSNFPTALNQPVDAERYRFTIWPATVRTMSETPVTSTTSPSSVEDVKKKPPQLWDGPPMLLTTILNETVIGTAFGVSEDLTDAHLSAVKIVDVPTNDTDVTITTTTANVTTIRNSVKVTPSSVVINAGSVANETVSPVTTTTRPTTRIELTTGPSKVTIADIIVQPPITSSKPIVHSDMTTASPPSSTIIPLEVSTEHEEVFPTNTTVATTTITIDRNQTEVIQNSTVITTTVTTTPTSSAFPVTSTVTSTSSATTLPEVSTIVMATTMPANPKRRLPNFLLNSRQTSRPRPSSPSTSSPRTTTTAATSDDVIREEDTKEDKYVPTLPPPLPTSTRRHHVITVPPIDDSGFIIDDDESEYEEAVMPVDEGLVPDGADEAIMVSCTIGGCAVVFFAVIMVFCMLRNRRTVYRAPDSSASSSASTTITSASPFHTKLG